MGTAFLSSASPSVASSPLWSSTVPLALPSSHSRSSLRAKADSPVGLATLAGVFAAGAGYRQGRRSLVSRARKGGGFGAPVQPKNKKLQPRSPTPSRLSTPSEGEISQLEQSIGLAVERHAPDIIAGLRDRGWWASDGPVLPVISRKTMRAEVEALWEEGTFKLSQSVRGTEYYDKENVYATEIGADKYNTAPRMVHYTVTAVKALAPRIREAFPYAQISSQKIGNKLNMSVGNGSAFDAHLDMGVAEKPFNRKLTLLLYLNNWREDLGGHLGLLGLGGTKEEAALDSGTAEAGLPVRLAPTSGRWVLFWADKVLHEVEESVAPGGLEDYRCSYTIWFCTEDGGSAAGPAQGGGGFETAPAYSRF